MRKVIFLVFVFFIYLAMNIGNFMVETCWAEGSYQKGKEEAIAQALKRAEEILREKALIQSSCSAQAERDFSRSRPQKSFFSDFSVNSPLTTLMGNPIGAASPYFCGLRESLMEPLGENLYGMLGMRYGYITGDTTYHIDFTNSWAVGGHGESELEFPLGNSLLGIEAALGYRGPYNDKQDRARLTLWWFTDIENDAGKMKDSDWIENDEGYLDTYVGAADWGQHAGKDIYSESDANLDTNIFDINYIYNFLPTKNVGIGPMMGYRYQRFEYVISDCNQVGYGPYDTAGYTGFAPGRVLDYDVRYHIWYLGLNSDVLIGDKFWLNLQANYMPWVSVEDEDKHLLTDLHMKGDCDGDGYLLNVNANWEFLPDWLLQVGGEYLDIETDGKAMQSVLSTGAQIGEVNDKITSSLWLISANLKYRF